MKQIYFSPWRFFRPLSIFIFFEFLALAAAVAAAPSKPAGYPDPWEIKAIQEMSTMASWEEVCAAETTYYVALEALNDSSVDFPSRPWDWINYGGGSYTIRPAEGRFGTSRINLLTAYNKWGGPYLTYQPGTWQTGTTPYDQGSPLDPWGNPYYFFSPLGLLRGDNGAVTLELYGDAFDRYTIFSLGNDMVPSGDDLVWQFGGGVYVTALTSLRGGGVIATDPTSTTTGFLAPAGKSMRLRGLNLGGPAPDARLLFDTQAIDSVTSWTTREIEFTMPAALGGRSGMLTLERGGLARGNGIQVTVYAVPDAARSWRSYE